MELDADIGKDPQGYKDFLDLLSSHSPIGSANTMRVVQAGRPAIYVWQREMEAIRVPTPILCGDEDEACVNPSLFIRSFSQGWTSLPARKSIFESTEIPEREARVKNFAAGYDVLEARDLRMLP